VELKTQERLEGPEKSGIKDPRDWKCWTGGKRKIGNVGDKKKDQEKDHEYLGK